jgi:hypothetical protein
MFATRHLILATVLAFQAAALPTADSNSSAADCDASWSAYSSSSSEYELPYSTSTISTAVVTSDSYSWETPLTTLCDGRARGNGPYITVHVPVETYPLDPWESEMYSTYTGASPTCVYPTVETSSPDSTPAPTVAPNPPCSGSCYIYTYASPILFHWPVVTASGDFCAQNGSTVTADPTIPGIANTAVVDGRTMTSPTNYVSFPAVYAMKHGQRRQVTSCGPSKDHVLLPITESFYSGEFNGYSSYSFNFQDLNTVREEAWNRQRRCGPFGTDCVREIIQTEYTPILPLPTEVLNFEPEEWKAAGCSGRATGYYFTYQALATPTPTAAANLLMS